MAGNKPDLLALLKLRLPSMTKVLKRIGSFIQENPEQVTVLSINEVADASDASIASVMRLCKELDYNSFAGLKLALATELAMRARDGQAESTSVSNASYPGQLAEELCDVFKLTAGLISEADIEAVAKQLINANHVLLHGVGASYMPAYFLSYKLTRLGIANYLSSDPHMTSMAANTSGDKELMILFSSSGSIRESIELAKQAIEKSLPTIAITNRSKSPLSEVCGQQLVAIGAETPLSSGSLESKCGQLFIVELLFEAICRLSDVHAERIRGAAGAVADMQY